MSVSYPNQYRNYCVIELPCRRNLDEIKHSLESPKSEDTVIEDLYELNLMLDEGNKDVAALYPVLSKYNNTDSPNVQTFLAGIYRKTKVPDAFGPLIAMLVRNAINNNEAKSVFTNPTQYIYPNNGAKSVVTNPTQYIYPNNEAKSVVTNPTQYIYPFDPNEEIGGAILDYLA